MIDGNEATIGDVAEDGTYTMQFEVTKPLSEKLNFKMVIDTGNPAYGKMEHETKIWFTSEENPTDVEIKTESIEYETIEKEDSSLKEGETKVKQKGVKGKKEITYELTYMAGNETKRKVKEESIIKNPVNEIILIGTKTETIEDGTYDIIAKAMHATKDEQSGAAQFINEKAQIVIKDGVIQFVITVPHNDMAVISGIQVEEKEGSVKDTKEGKVYTFTLDRLKEVLNSQVQYNVPSLGMDHDVEFRFVLEGLDKLPIKIEEQDVKDNNNGKGNGNGATPTKPKFGSNDKDAQEVAASTNDGKKNPQTGDTSAIMFYTLLLIGSLIPLAVKFKRRFV